MIPTQIHLQQICSGHPYIPVNRSHIAKTLRRIADELEQPFVANSDVQDPNFIMGMHGEVCFSEGFIRLEVKETIELPAN